MWNLPGPEVEPVSPALQLDCQPLDHQESSKQFYPKAKRKPLKGFKLESIMIRFVSYKDGFCCNAEILLGEQLGDILDISDMLWR